ncbi:MAG TPA: class I SAM-dependent methyltransferase [Gaiellaceae bacterium]|nr:class I SAM-dependent methyltransferase [Gaiellaceae bacterium]
MSVFDAAVDRYDEVRPEYPAELFDDLVALARLEPGARLLEVGCATGKATRPLLARGYRVTCIEPGHALAGRARELGLDVHNARFEDFESDERFDLVFAATSWHWVDPTVRYAKARALLRSGGQLAFWGAFHALPEGFDPFFTGIQEVYDEIGESWQGKWPPPPPADQVEEVEASGLFGDVQVRRYLWELPYTAEEYIALIATFSGHIEMTAAQRERLYSEIRSRLGARKVRRHWEAVLHVARRLDM